MSFLKLANIHPASSSTWYFSPLSSAHSTSFTRPGSKSSSHKQSAEERVASGPSDHLLELKRLLTLLIKFPLLELMDLPLLLALWHKRLTMRIGSQITTSTVLLPSASRAVLPARSVLLLNRSFFTDKSAVLGRWMGGLFWGNCMDKMVYGRGCIMMEGRQREIKAHICTLSTAPGNEF